jgi:hypothetical protein
MDDTDTAEDELTEFETIEVESIKAVPSGANGFPHLIMKGVAAEPGADDAYRSAVDLAVKAVVNGQIDQAPDVAVGQQIMHLLGQAIINEAQEVSAGAYGETSDVSLLTRAADMIGRWCAGEQGGCGCCPDCTGPGCGCCWDCPSQLMQSAWSYEADEVAKAPREFSAAEREKHAKAGNALPDGSYPIPDKDALRRAAILARSGHGNVAAAKKLIAKRAKELGVPNPLDDESDDTSKSVVAEGETTVHTDTQGTGALTKSDLDAAIAKAIEPLKAENASLRAEVAKVKATPIPGGPVLSANARPLGSAQSAEAEDYAAKAAKARWQAENATSPGDRQGFRQLAREYDEAAKRTTVTPAG